MKIRRIKNTAEKQEKRSSVRRMDNRGLTLIELVVTVGIIAIFSAVVLTFISTGGSTYRSTSSSAKVQMETQELVDKMEDMIIDVNRSLYYANGSGENMGSEIKNDIKQSGAGNSTGSKTFIICNEYKNSDGKTSQYICDVLDWDKDDETVYYSQREYTASSSSEDSDSDAEVASFSADEGAVAVFSADEEDGGEQNVRNARTKVERSVLATGILDFRADLTKVESDKIVRFQLSTQNGKKQIETLHSVSLRNKVKVKKPADDFNNAESTNVGIYISYAPASMDPDTSDTLAYNLTGNGSIDPSTLTWTVVSGGENGSFPIEDQTNSSLTINADAAGSITVKVSARTNSGKWIQSAPVTIQITAKPTPAPTEAPKPKELQINPVVNLVANDASYNISDIIGNGVTVLYDDGSTKAPDSVKWELMDAEMMKTYVTLNGDTVLLTERAGVGTGGSFSLKATDTDTNLSCIVDIKIARLELNTPSGTYKVGDKKPLSFRYMEGGADGSLDASKLKLEGKTAIATADASYVPGEKFNVDAACDWTLTASYDLSDRGGLGTVKDTTNFTVERQSTNEDGELILTSDMKYDTVVAGKTYYCSVSPANVMNFFLKTDKFKWDSSARIKWSVKGGSGNVTVDSKSNPADQSPLYIPEGETQGFTLCAEYTRTGDNGEEIRVYAERSFRVANGISFRMTDRKDRQIQLGDTLTKDQKYKVTISVNIYDVDGNQETIAVTPSNAVNYHIRDGLNGKTEATEDNLGWYYTPDFVGDVTLDVGVFKIEDRICGNDWNYGFTSNLSFKVSKKANATG